MHSSIKLITNYQYKKLFLPDISEKVLLNSSKIQIYKLENYIRSIVIPVLPYRTTFNFLFYISNGQIRQFLAGSTIEVGANQILNIKQGSITATLEVSPDIEGYFIAYENEIITHITLRRQDFVFFHSYPLFSIRSESTDWIMRLFKLLEDEFLLEDRNMSVCFSLFQSILVKIIRTESYRTEKLSRQLDIAFRFRELVQKYHIDHKNVQFYSALLNISENYLNKSVKEVTNKPPKQWINDISILHSQVLLQDTSRNIAGIAFELNYESPSYFTRLFKKVTGLSPTEYRQIKIQ